MRDARADLSSKARALPFLLVESLPQRLAYSRVLR